MVRYRINRKRACCLGYDNKGLRLGARVVASPRDGHRCCSHIRIVAISYRIVRTKRQGRGAILHYYGWGNSRTRIGLVGYRIYRQRACSLGYNCKGLGLCTRIAANTRDRQGRCAHIRIITVSERIVCAYG